MKLRQHLSILAAAVATAFTASDALAIPLLYDVSGGTVSANSGPGLIINHSLSPTLSNQAFTLDDGDSFTFNFFVISTPESSVNFGEDTVPRPISATLNFSTPGESATLSGVTFGVNIFLLHVGIVDWSNAVTVVAADRVFEVSFSDAAYNLGFMQLDNRPEAAATILATVRQISSTAPSVPDSGSSIALLSAGLLGLAALRRRFNGR